MLSQFVNLLDIANSIEVFQIFATFPEISSSRSADVRAKGTSCLSNAAWLCCLGEQKHAETVVACRNPINLGSATPKKHSASLAIQLQRKSLLLCCFMIVFNKIPTQTFHQTKICALLLGIIQWTTWKAHLRTLWWKLSLGLSCTQLDDWKVYKPRWVAM